MVGKKICVFVKMIIAAALLCFFTMPFSALAYNADYMSSEKWNSKNVVSADFVKKGAAGEMSGTYKYFWTMTTAVFISVSMLIRVTARLCPKI